METKPRFEKNFPVRDIRFLAEDSVFDQLVDHTANTFFGRLDSRVTVFLQDDRLDPEHLCRRTGQTASLDVGVDVVQVPLLHEQSFSLQGCDLAIDFGLAFFVGRVGHRFANGHLDFGRNASSLVFHDAASGERSRQFVKFDHSDERRKLDIDDFPTVADIASDAGRFVLDVDHLFQVGDLRDAELFGRLRTRLGRVAVDRLTSAEDEVVIADRLNRLTQDVAGRERVAGRSAAIREEDHTVSAEEEAVAEDLARFRGAHRDASDRSAESVADVQGRFQSVKVFRVENGGQGSTVDRSVILHGVSCDVRRVGDLLH
jgi:hypothetical protein